jgi:PhnB protein
LADVNPVPDDYPQVTPYLIVQGAAAAIDFYTAVFGATERMRMPGPNDTVGHCELQLGRGLVMLADEFAEMGIFGPKTVGGTPVIVSVYVEDVDAVFERALQLGATSLRPIKTEFYGDRSGQFEDPFGHRWSVATHVEDVPPEEMERRAAEAAATGGAGG